MQGMSRDAGVDLGGFEHLRQSVIDILTTPKGTRVMRRDYGSDLPRLVDRPVNQSLIAALRAEAVDALAKWEPRLRCERVNLLEVGQGSVTMDITFTYLPQGREVTLQDLRIGGFL
jgi:phage baseplate assembly protein W